MKIIPIDDDVYYAKIFIIPQCTHGDLVKYFQRVYGTAYEEKPRYDALHYTLENNETGLIIHYIILVNFKNTVPQIALLQHEIDHLVFDVMAEVGIKIAPESEEAFTYYKQYITQKILNKLL